MGIAEASALTILAELAVLPTDMSARQWVAHEPQVRASYHKLLDKGKKPMQALVAVMRKLLHAIYGMFQHDADFDGTKFYAAKA